MNTNDSNEPFLAARAESVGGDECEANVWNARCQATLWFCGRVFVFENVPCDKVNFTLLVLGGYEFNGSSTTGVAARITSNDPMRRECLNRYYQKKKRRCYHKKIRYSVRRDIALKIHREGGQFAGKNVKERSRSLGMMGETKCGNCGVSSKDTPMMRKGPNGPNTLCNACGLAWTRTK